MPSSLPPSVRTLSSPSFQLLPNSDSSVTCVADRPLVLDLLEYLIQVVGLGALHRRVLSVGFKFLQPQNLAERNNVPVVEIRSNWSGKCPFQVLADSPAKRRAMVLSLSLVTCRVGMEKCKADRSEISDQWYRLALCLAAKHSTTVVLAFASQGIISPNHPSSAGQVHHESESVPTGNCYRRFDWSVGVRSPRNSFPKLP